nr:craniofacial development protein 2-like [Nicotiana tomentosiformis]
MCFGFQIIGELMVVYSSRSWIKEERIPEGLRGRVKGKNEVCILVDRDLRELVVEVRRVNDKLMAINIVMGGCTLNVVSAYVPQVDLDEEVRRRFWEDLDGMVWGISSIEKLFIGGDLNDHIGRSPGGGAPDNLPKYGGQDPD